MKKLLIFILLLQFSSIALARMYQWVDPDTGTTQLSGKPPVWYRSTQGGPRVFVFENGRLLDDTGISLSAAENDRLRQQSLLMAEQDRQAAMEKLLQARRQKALMDIQNNEESEEENLTTAPIQEERPVIEEQTAAAERAPTAEELRALIDQYESQRTREAKQLLEGAVPRDAR